MKNQKHLQKIIEEEIEVLIRDLKPELKERFEYVWRDDIKISKESTITAQTITFSGPAKKIIIFYTKAISEIIYKGLKKWMKELLKHEIAHLFTLNEQEAAKREKAFNIFKNE